MCGNVIPGSVQPEEMTSLGNLHVCEDVKTRGFDCQRFRGAWPIAGEILESGEVNGENPGAAAGDTHLVLLSLVGLWQPCLC